MKSFSWELWNGPRQKFRYVRFSPPLNGRFSSFHKSLNSRMWWWSWDKLLFFIWPLWLTLALDARLVGFSAVVGIKCYSDSRGNLLITTNQFWKQHIALGLTYTRSIYASGWQNRKDEFQWSPRSKVLDNRFCVHLNRFFILHPLYLFIFIRSFRKLLFLSVIAFWLTSNPDVIAILESQQRLTTRLLSMYIISTCLYL
jgi:hypothetical protein